MDFKGCQANRTSDTCRGGSKALELGTGGTCTSTEVVLTPDILKKIIIRKDCIISLSNGEAMRIYMLKPIPVTQFVKILDVYKKQGYVYLDYGPLDRFLAESAGLVGINFNEGTEGDGI